MSTSVFLLFFVFVDTVSGFLFCNPPCGTPSIQPRSFRIVGGHEAVEGSLPWTVAIIFSGYFVCSGSIVNERFILTAAHCFDRHDVNVSDISAWHIIAGKHRLDKISIGERSYPVEAIIMHSNFTAIGEAIKANDIALLKLGQDITYTTKIQPICLPSAQERLMVGQPCIVAGWGVTFNFLEEYTALRQVTVPIVSDDVCAQPTWQQALFLPQLTVCAGYEEGGRDACTGDSGSPLICEFLGKWYASGIVSTGHQCALPRKPGIYTNVSHYSPWIRDQMLANGYTLSCS